MPEFPDPTLVDSLQGALTDVDLFISRHRGHYEQFLESVLRELSEYRDIRRNSSPIYRLYSRADKQIGGEKLKSRLGIAKKLANWRREEKGDRRIRVNEVHDIIGVTIVTYFESEIAFVAGALRKARFKTFKVLSDTSIARSDYNAQHIIVLQNGSGFGIGGRLCEIQIKSLLHDGWSTRTHNMYKDKDLSPKIKKRIESLTRLVKSLEEESDSLREDMQKVEREDSVRRDAAARQLFTGLLEKVKDRADVTNSHLANVLTKERAYFAECPTDDVVLIETLSKWQDARASTGDHQTACRLMAMLALLRTLRDFDDEALGAIEVWLDASSDDAERAKALSLKALTNWALGYLDDAISTARDVLALASELGMKTTTAKWNLAYYLAEKCDRENKPELHSDELKRLVEELTVSDDDRQKMSFQDTLGAIKIMTSTTRSGIFEGQRLCEEAQRWSVANGTDQDIFQIFYELHERCAVRRLQNV